MYLLGKYALAYFPTFHIEYASSKYSSSFLRFINRFVPFHRTKSQFSSFEISRSLLIPIPVYAAASSNVRLLFSQTGISILICTLTICHFVHALDDNIYKGVHPHPFSLVVVIKISNHLFLVDDAIT